MAQETKSTELVILDTCIFIDYVRNHQPAVTYIQGMNEKERDKICVSIITVTELLAGQSCNENLIRTGIIEMLNSFKKIEVDNQIAIKAGDLCRKYGIAIPDALIAASGLIKGATIVTKNSKDFKQIPNIMLQIPY